MTSPLALNVGKNDGGVTRNGSPLTFLPLAPCGVIVTVTVTVWPGCTVTGLPPLCVGSNATGQKSPVLDVTSGSNARVCAVATSVDVPAGAGPLNGPICWTNSSQAPGAT